MATDLDGLRDQARAILLRRLRSRAAEIVGRRPPPAPPVVNVSTDTLAVHAGSAGLQTGILSLNVESVPVTVNLDPHLEVPAPIVPVTVNVSPADVDLAPIGRMVADAVREMGQQIVAALKAQKPSEVTAEPAKVVMPPRKPVAFRLERDANGDIAGIVQEG